MSELLCSYCKRRKEAENVFVYEGMNYCFECASVLVYDLVESGHLYAQHDDFENKGVRLNW